MDFSAFESDIVINYEKATRAFDELIAKGKAFDEVLTQIGGKAGAFEQAIQRMGASFQRVGGSNENLTQVSSTLGQIEKQAAAIVSRLGSLKIDLGGSELRVVADQLSRIQSATSAGFGDKFATLRNASAVSTSLGATSLTAPISGISSAATPQQAAASANAVTQATEQVKTFGTTVQQGKKSVEELVAAINLTGRMKDIEEAKSKGLATLNTAAKTMTLQQLKDGWAREGVALGATTATNNMNDVTNIATQLKAMGAPASAISQAEEARRTLRDAFVEAQSLAGRQYDEVVGGRFASAEAAGETYVGKRRQREAERAAQSAEVEQRAAQQREQAEAEQRAANERRLTELRAQLPAQRLSFLEQSSLESSLTSQLPFALRPGARDTLNKDRQKQDALWTEFDRLGGSADTAANKLGKDKGLAGAMDEYTDRAVLARKETERLSAVLNKTFDLAGTPGAVSADGKLNKVADDIGGAPLGAVAPANQPNIPRGRGFLSGLGSGLRGIGQFGQGLTYATSFLPPELMQAIPGMGAVRTMGMVGSLVGGGAGAALGLGGLAVGGVAGAAAAAKAYLTELEKIERREIAVRNLGKAFGDVANTIDQTRKATEGITSTASIVQLMQGVNRDGALARGDNFSNLAEVAKSKSYELGTTFEQSMATMIQAIQSGNGPLLEQMNVIDSTDRALLNYAESIGKTVPQLSEMEVQQALITAALERYNTAGAAAPSISQQIYDANATLKTSWSELKDAAILYVAALSGGEFATGAEAYLSWLDKANNMIWEQVRALQAANAARKFQSSEAPESDKALVSTLGTTAKAIDLTGGDLFSAGMNALRGNGLPLATLGRAANTEEVLNSGAPDGMTAAALLDAISKGVQGGSFNRNEIEQITTLVQGLDQAVKVMTNLPKGSPGYTSAQFIGANAVESLGLYGALAQPGPQQGDMLSGLLDDALQQRRAQDALPKILNQWEEADASLPMRLAATGSAGQAIAVKKDYESTVAGYADSLSKLPGETVGEKRKALETEVAVTESQIDALIVYLKSLNKALTPEQEGMLAALENGDYLNMGTAAPPGNRRPQGPAPAPPPAYLSYGRIGNEGYSFPEFTPLQGPRLVNGVMTNGEINTERPGASDAPAANAEAMGTATAAAERYQAALTQLTLAQLSGDAAAIQLAQSNLRGADAQLAALQPMQDMADAATNVVTIGGQLYSTISGLPVAYNAASLSQDQMARSADRLSITLQNMTSSAQNAARNMAAALVPQLGLSGAYEKGTAFATEFEGLESAFRAKSSEHEKLTGSPLDEQYLANAQQALSANQRQRVSDITNPQTGGGSGGADRAADALNNAIDGMIKGLRLNTTEGLISIDEILPREDEIDEKARRMADVAVKGFQSPWFEEMKEMFPDDVLAEGEEKVKQSAASMVRQHQQGLTTIFLDQGKAAQQVIDQIKGREQMDEWIEEVRGKVKELAGTDASKIDIMEALGIDVTDEKASEATKQLTATYEQIISGINAIGSDPTKGPLAAVTEVTDSIQDKAKESGTTIMTIAGDAMISQVGAEGGNYGGRAIGVITAQVEAKKAAIQQSGRNVGEWMGNSMLEKFGETVPVGLLEILVSELVPLIEASMKAKEERGGGSGGGGGTP